MLKWLLGIFGLVLVVLFWRLSWQLGYLVLILYLLWVVLQMPSKLKRRLLLAYFAFSVALISSTYLHTTWVRSESLQRAVNRSVILRALAGSSPKLAFWAVLVGLVIGAASVWGMLEAVLYISSEFVLNLSTGIKVTRKEARQHLLDLLLQRQRSSMIAEDGQLVVKSPAGLVKHLGGPGLIVVRPGNAVVLESVEGVSRILGPGADKLQPFEKVKEVVDLRPQEEEVTLSDILTKDQIPLTLHINISFQIEPRADTEARPEFLTERKHFDQTIAGTYPVYQETVFKAAYRVSKGGWRKATISALALALRDVVSGYNLDDLFEYPKVALAQDIADSDLVISTLGPQVQTELTERAQAWGIRVNHVDIVRVEMPEEIRETILTRWRKKWEAEIAEYDAAKEAAGWEKQLEIRRDALTIESDIRIRRFE